METISIITTTRKGAHLITNGLNVAWIQPRQRRADGTFTPGAYKALEESTMTVAQYQAQQTDRAATSISISRLTVVRETEKAIAVKATCSYFNHLAGDFETNEKWIWLPKSMIKNGEIAKWFLNKKLEEAAEYFKGGLRTYTLEVAPAVVEEATEEVENEEAKEEAGSEAAEISTESTDNNEDMKRNNPFISSSKWREMTFEDIANLFDRYFPDVAIQPNGEIVSELRRLGTATLELLEDRTSSSVYRIRETGVVFQVDAEDGKSWVYDDYDDYLKDSPIDAIVVKYVTDPATYEVIDSKGGTVTVRRNKAPRFKARYDASTGDVDLCDREDPIDAAKSARYAREVAGVANKYLERLKVN